MNLKKFEIEELFAIQTGDYHATKNLTPGNVPLMSCGDSDNGLIGYYDIPRKHQYSGAITVAYNGQPLTAKFHPYSFGAKDDVAVLQPKMKMSRKTLIYVAAVFNQMRWRYSYGRKCFKRKMNSLELELPATERGRLDQSKIENVLSSLGATLPEKTEVDRTIEEPHAWTRVKLSDLFKLQHGDFNALPDEEGDIPTVSRMSVNNGITGYYTAPEDAGVYEPPRITVSTVSGKAFVQLQPFIASDKVVILTPQADMKLSELHCAQAMIDHEAWRYSYGRSCFKSKLRDLEVYMPVDPDGNLDRKYMDGVMSSTPYWDHLSTRPRRESA